MTKVVTIDERVSKLEFKDERREQHYNELKKDVVNIDENVSKMLHALIGSGLDSNTGLIYDISQLKNRLKNFEDKLENLTNKNIEYSVYFKILGIVSTALLVSTITLLFKTFNP